MIKISRQLPYHILAIIIVSIWGTTYISTSILLNGGTNADAGNGLSPIQIYTLRSMIAYVGLLAVCHRKIFADNLRDELTFLLLGLTGGTIYYLCENSAVEYSDPANISLIISTVPIATMILTAAVYKTRPTLPMISGGIIAIGGISCVIFADTQSHNGAAESATGYLLAVAAVASWAIYSVIISKMFSRYTTLFITRKVFFYGLCSALIVISFGDDQIFPIEILSQGVIICNLLYLGIVASLLCFWTFNIAMRHIGIVATNNYGYLTPVVTFVFAIIILGNDFTWIGAVGTVITLFGLWIAQRNNTSA